jgi:hypothetical protein
VSRTTSINGLGYALFAGDFNKSVPQDEFVYFGYGPDFTRAHPVAVSHVACYSLATGALTQLWYQPSSGAVLYQSLPSQHVIAGMRDDSSIIFISLVSGSQSDQAILERPLLQVAFFEAGTPLQAYVAGISGDSIFVYRFDAITDVEDETNPVLPDEFSLSQNYPNPFNGSTEIRFSLPRASDITLTIYNLLGQEVSTLASGRLTAGVHRISWDGTDFEGNLCASGVYLYRLATDNSTQSRKMLLLK